MTAISPSQGQHLTAGHDLIKGAKLASRNYSVRRKYRSIHGWERRLTSFQHMLLGVIDHSVPVPFLPKDDGLLCA